MQVLNAVALARFALRNAELGSEIEFGTALWFSYAGICAFLVLFAGLMSGLTLGLMSLSLVDLEILKRSGTPTEQKQSGQDQLHSFYSINRGIFFMWGNVLCTEMGTKSVVFTFSILMLVAGKYLMGF